MSFILDALRKSEHERQRSAVPGVAQVPFAVPRRGTPRWALAVIGTLALALAVLGAAWWQTTRTGSEQAAVAATQPPARPLVEASPQPSPRAPRVEPAGPPTGASSDDRPAPALATRAVPSTPAGTSPPRTSPLTNDPPAAAPASATPALPSAAALAAEGFALPPLRLTLHAYSENAAERFVFINGTRYREGETLREGPRIVSIERSGVVLSQQGRRFLLAAQQ